MPPTFLSQLITSKGEKSSRRINAMAAAAVVSGTSPTASFSDGMSPLPQDRVKMGLNALNLPITLALGANGPARPRASLDGSAPSSTGETQKQMNDFFQKYEVPAISSDKENKIINIREMRSNNSPSKRKGSKPESETLVSRNNALESLFAARAQQVAAPPSKVVRQVSHENDRDDSGARIPKQEAKRPQDSGSSSAHPLAAMLLARQNQKRDVSNQIEHDAPAGKPESNKSQAHPLATMLQARQQQQSASSSEHTHRSNSNQNSSAAHPLAAMLKKRQQQSAGNEPPARQVVSVNKSSSGHPLAQMLQKRQQQDQAAESSVASNANKSSSAHPLAQMLQKRQQPAPESTADETPVEEVAKPEPALKDDPKYATYFRMVKIGLAPASVRHKMISENVDPAILDLDPDKPLSVQSIAPASNPNDEDPEYKKLLSEYNEKMPKYNQMLKVGLPRPVVEHKMRSEGADPAWLDGPPKPPTKPAGPTAAEIEAHKQKYGKYLQMLKIGLPRGAVEHKMIMAGLDPAALDGPQPHKNASNGSAKPVIKLKRAESIRKKIHWQVKRHESIDAHRDSLWGGSVFDDTLSQVQVSRESKEGLEKLFVKTISEKPERPSKKTSAKGNAFQKKQLITLIDMKKSQNIAITLARIKLTHAELKHELLNMNPMVLSSAQLQALIDMWPDQQEQVAIDNYHGDVELLGAAEKFLVETRNIPRFKEKLRCLIFKQEFPNRVHELRESITLVIRGVNQVICSQALKQLFIYILQIGNLLNFGLEAENTSDIGGFSLGSLVKLSQTKAFVGGITFLQYVVQSVERDCPSLSHFHKEISLVSRCSKVSLGMLTTEKKTLEAGMKSLVHEAQAVSSNETDIEAQLASSILRNFAYEVEQNLEAIQSLLDQMEQSKQKFLQYFEEEETSEQLDELLGYIANFVQEYRHEHEKYVTKKAEEEKAANDEKRQILAVTGPVDAESVGFALPHELVLHNINACVRPMENERLPSSGISNESLMELREDPLACGGVNLALVSEDEAFRELERLPKRSDGAQNLVVDVATTEEAQDLRKRLPELSRRANLLVVACTGINNQMLAKASALDHEAAIEQVTKALESQLHYGSNPESVDNSFHYGAFYQQVECDGDDAAHSLVAASIAQASSRLTVPVYLSFSWRESVAEQVYQARIIQFLTELEQRDIDVRKVAVAHADRWCSSDGGLSFLQLLLSRGVSLVFNMIGWYTVTDVAVVNPTRAWRNGTNVRLPEPPRDSAIAASLAALLAQGNNASSQIMLSTGMHQRIQYVKYGGPGYAYLSQHFRRRLERVHSLTEHEWTQLTRTNACDFLTWYVPPAKAAAPKHFLQCTICKNHFEPIEGEYFTKFAFIYCGTKCLPAQQRIGRTPAKMAMLARNRTVRCLLQSHARRYGGRLTSMSMRSFHVGLAGADTPGDGHVERLRTEGVQTLRLNAPVFQVYGSNTDVGKTIVSAGICRAAVSEGSRVAYIKPLQTGTDDDDPNAFPGDAAFIKKHMRGLQTEGLLECSTLFSWKTAVSPHLASMLESHEVSDEQLLKAIEDKLQVINSEFPANSLALVETAGGVCSPSASMRFQADVYRSLRLPVVLVGDGKLGGISATMSAVESLILRGYDVAAVCVIEQDGLDNGKALRPRLSELEIPLYTMESLPPMPTPLHDWFSQHSDVFKDVNASLHTFHHVRVKRLHQMLKDAENKFWWPFTQHKKYGGLSLIDSAHGDEFCMYKKETNELHPMFDACASWWTQGIGHGNAKMSMALAYTAGRYGHVMFPENVHEPALQLTEKLLATVGDGWATRVYFTDDGSTAVEVALKMAFRKFASNREASGSPCSKDDRLIVLAQANCYHGDTLGAMNVAEPSVFNEKQHPWYKPKAAFLKTPSLAFRGGKYHVEVKDEIANGVSTGETFTDFGAACSVDRDGSSLAKTYRVYVNRVLDEAERDQTLVGALLLEPILIGAGGMILVDPLFQRVTVNECRARGIPVVYDEVFSGWWRLGVESARDLLGVNPDIACYAKLLTGGVVPLAVTLSSEDVFNTFYADTKGEALLHGHSFTAHPIGCAAAITALDMYDIENARQSSRLDGSLGNTRVYWNQSKVCELSKLPHVERAFELGTVLAIELKSTEAGYASNEAQVLIQALRQRNIYARALGNVVYMMCSPLTSQDDCSRWLETLEQCTRNLRQ
ncbi:TPA: hypothetical protein N0F65_008583 [Lagenidium giganteum]|uniref:FH2 domain-containing protein n=1 Tax=Lagenidium giganteum TaxID=4803 RepID=A0AAV2Z087_9STRA|nr:TPA: hypothetical protein N0F65_008583 [Lagenidium giganteum]